MKKQFITIRNLVVPTRCLHYKYINGFYVPCGKCASCRKKNVDDWAFRVSAESKYKYVYSGLLSYNEENLPMYNGSPTVEKVHIQLFIKLLRYHIYEIFGARISYFAVGEYGGKKGRPHYHILLFSDYMLHSDDTGGFEFLNELIQSVWDRGFSDFELANCAGSASAYMTLYLAGYDDGKVYDKHNKPFRLSSRNPAIGKCWIDDNPKQVKYMQDTMNYSYPCGEFNRPLPRYYKRKIMPEAHQIYFADEYFEQCKAFKEWYDNLTRNEKFDYEKRRKIRQEWQKQRDIEQYRKRKVHKDGRGTLGLSSQCRKVR